MIRRVHRIWPRPALVVRLWLLTATQAVLQGLLLGLLVPILRALLRPEPDLAAATPWLIVGAIGLTIHAALNVLVPPIGFAACMDLAIQLRHRLMAHVTTLPLGWFTSARKGEFVLNVTAVSHHLAELTYTVGAPAIAGVVVPVTVTGIALAVDWRLAAPLVVTLPVALVALHHSRRVVADVSADMLEAFDDVVGRTIEYGQAQPVLRAAGQGATGTVRMRDALEDGRRRYRRGLRRMLPPDLVYRGLVMAGVVAVLVLGVQGLLEGTLALADAVVVLVLAVRFLESLGGLIDHVSGLGAMDHLADRVEAVLATPALPRSPRPVRRIDHPTIELSHVGYAYGETPALTDVSFRCPPGTTTALVGPSGSGKTTVTRLIARFFDVDTGSVRVGGIDVRDYDHATLLGEIAVVFQDVYLFDTTIEENLRIARPDATAGALAAAARAARLDEVVDRLTDGWHTRVGEGGAQLSGGERQRVSIARAFLKRARIVLIDEPSSALDPENEAAIGQAIAALAEDPDRTVIVIAHRPTTLAAADQVVALDAGRVAETGTPVELLTTGGAFARLHAQHQRARGWRITSRTR